MDNIMQTVIKDEFRPESVKVKGCDLCSEAPYIFELSPDPEEYEVAFCFSHDQGWLTPAEAIALGQKLIRVATKAQLAETVSDQHTICMLQLKLWIAEKRVSKVKMTVISEQVPNQPEGTKLMRVNPVFVSAEATPDFGDIFQFETAVKWSEDTDEFAEQINYFGVPIELIGHKAPKSVCTPVELISYDLPNRVAKVTLEEFIEGMRKNKTAAAEIIAKWATACKKDN